MQQYEEFFAVQKLPFYQDVYTGYRKFGYHIVYAEGCEQAGKQAHYSLYRTERHAIRGAQRLYQRTIKDFEDIVILGQK